MPSLQKLDRLNVISTKRKSIDIKEWFETMELQPYQKERRIHLAHDICDCVCTLLAIIMADIEAGADLDREYYNSFLIDGYMKAVSENGIDTSIYPGLENYIQDISPKIVESTLKHTSDPNNGYWLSEDRATKIGAEESSTVINNVEFSDAKSSRFKYKTWHTQLDNRVRGTHMKVESETIPINEYFNVGLCTMLYPHDLINGTPEEVDGCRCTIEYH